MTTAAPRCPNCKRPKVTLRDSEQDGHCYDTGDTDCQREEFANEMRAPRSPFTCSKCGGSEIAISHQGDPFCRRCAPCPCAKHVKELEARAVTPETVIALTRALDEIDTDEAIEIVRRHTSIPQEIADTLGRNAGRNLIGFYVGPGADAIKQDLARLVMERAGIGGGK